MNNKNKLIFLLIFVILSSGCFNKHSLELTQITKVEWKAIFEEDEEYFHLYVTLNDKTDFYAGDYFHSANFELNENSYVSDAPENALSTLSTMETQTGHWFYIYQKNDIEIAVMYHPVIYPEWYIQSMKKEIGEEAYVKQYEVYQEILIIPIEKGSQIQIEDTVTINADFNSKQSKN